MNTKAILAILASTITGFLLGWVIWGIALADFYEANMVHYEGLMNAEPPIWIYLITNLAISLLYYYVIYHLSGIRSVGKAVAVAMITTFLSTLPYELYFLTGMNLYSGMAILTDIIGNVVMGGVMSAVIILVMGTGKKD